MSNPNTQRFNDSYLTLEDVQVISALLEQEYDWVRVHRDMEVTRSLNPMVFTAETAGWGMEEWAESRRYGTLERYLEDGDLSPDGFRIVAGRSGAGPTISIYQSERSIEVEYDRLDQFDHTSFLMGERIAELLLGRRLKPRYLSSRFFWLVVGFTCFQLGFEQSLIASLASLSVAIGIHIYRHELPRIHLVLRDKAKHGRRKYLRRAISGGLLFAIVSVVLVVYFP